MQFSIHVITFFLFQYFLLCNKEYEQSLIKYLQSQSHLTLILPTPKLISLCHQAMLADQL